MNLDIFENKKNFPLFSNKSVSKIIIIVSTCLNEGAKTMEIRQCPFGVHSGDRFWEYTHLVREYNVICAGKGKNESVFKYEWGLRRKTLHHVLEDDWPEKTADFLRHHHWFPGERTSEKRAQKLHTDDMSLPRSGKWFWLAEANFPSGPTKSKRAWGRPMQPPSKT